MTDPGQWGQDRSEGTLFSPCVSPELYLNLKADSCLLTVDSLQVTAGTVSFPMCSSVPRVFLYCSSLVHAHANVHSVKSELEF